MQRNLRLRFKNPRSAKAKRGAPPDKKSRFTVNPDVNLTARRKSTRVAKLPKPVKPTSEVPKKKKKKSQPTTTITNQSPPPLLTTTPDSTTPDSTTPARKKLPKRAKPTTSEVPKKKKKTSQSTTTITNQSPAPLLTATPDLTTPSLTTPDSTPDSTTPAVNTNKIPNPPDLITLLDDVKEFNQINPPNNDSVLAIDALPHTKAHESRINQVLDDYVNCLLCYKNKWEKLLTLERFDGPGNYVRAPKILIAIGGDKSNTKTQLANLSLIDWMAITKKKKANSDEGSKLKMSRNPYYQPSTQNQRLRTFFGTVQRIFNWQYQLSDFDFNSGLTGFINKLYIKREKEFGKVMLINFFYFQQSIYISRLTSCTLQFYLKSGWVCS